MRTNDGDVTFKTDELATISEYVQNIIATYNRADADCLANGGGWYKYAQVFCESIAADVGLDLDTVAAVVAVLSNNVTWKQQVTYTAPFIRAVLAGTPPEQSPGNFLRVGKLKAARIIGGELSALSGPKVTCFYHNICGRYHLATIDRHAIRIALGRNTDEAETQKYAKGRKRLLIDAAYHEAARQLGGDVAIIQAITWCVYRGTHE